MSVTVVKQVVAEIRGKSDKLEADLKAAETRLARTKASVEGLGGGVDRLGVSYGRTAQRIAGATETIARSGTVTGGAAKQIVSGVSQIAFAFGKTGAMVGAASIGALAVASSLQRIREEVQQTMDEIQGRTKRSIAALNQFRDLDAKGQTKALDLLRTGRDDVALPGADITDEGLEARGIARLRRELAALEIQITRANEAKRKFREGDRSRPVAAAAATAGRELPGLTEKRDAYARVLEDLLLREQRYESILAGTAATERDAADATSDRETAMRRVTDALKGANAALVQWEKDTVEFGRKFEDFALNQVGDSVSQVAAEFDKLIEQGRNTVGASDPRVVQLEAWKIAAVDAARAIQQAQEILNNLSLAGALGTAPTVATFRDLTVAAASLRSELAKLTPGSVQYLAVQKQLLDVERERSNLLKGIASAGNGTGRTDRGAGDMARQLQQAADGALQLAQNLLGADAATIGLLRSLSQIAGNIPSLQKALNIGSERVEGGKIDGLGVLSAALPILGAISSLFGASPEQQARQAELRKNTKALGDLTERAGLLGLGATGSASLGASTGVAQIIAAEKRFRAEQVRRLGPLEGNRIADASFNARKTAEAMGLDWDELKKTAAEYGIALNKNVTSIEQFQAALEAAGFKLAEFGDDLTSQMSQAEAEIAIMGVTDPNEKLAIRTGAVRGRSPAFDSLLAGLDLTTTEGRAEARKRTQELFELMKAGGGSLDAAGLGGLTGDELLQALLDLIEGLNEVDEEQGIDTSTQTEADRIVTADRTQITADQASRLLGLASSQLTELRIIRQALTASTSPLPLPSAGVFSTAPTSAPAGGISLVIHQHNEFHGPVTDGALVAEQSMEGIVEHIRRALGQDVIVRRQYSGNPVTS